MSEAIQKIESILKNEYSTKGFVDFSVEIFDSLKIVAPEKFHKEFSNFSSHIEGYSHIGDYCTPDVKKVAVFSVRLKIASYVENSRSTQRSYARKLIEAGNCDAAVIAFYSLSESKWRLSFVRLDYEMKYENGKFITTENLTPAKRYSFLVGKDEPCHTAISRFHKFIIDKNFNPSLDELEDAFSVEKVTKEFFDLYCEKFYQLQEHLDSNQDFKDESRKCGFNSEQFAKKLMGQIVFLYFLQKKGWLGVSVWPSTLTEKEYKNVYFVSGAHGRIIREHLPQIYIQLTDGNYRLNATTLDELSDDDEEVIASHMPCIKTWGDGSKKFLRTVFEWSQKHKGHFYDEYLEPLFYHTLNRNRGTLGYCPELHCKVPFLSGGLFDPLDNYDWRSNCFDIPDEMFSNRKEENDHEGNGILDIFDRYNFTISEDEPMEREVAIDPEMLGKVFENLLEVKDRKSKGAFYTPREIVHYMCQESLVNYLVRKTALKEDAIREFILYGDLMKDVDTSKDKREGVSGMYISEDLFKIDDAGKIVVNRLNDIDNALAAVCVADPAVGSGAFPLGMMNEIVRARQNITAYITIGMNAFDKRFVMQNERAPYFLKRHTIKNSIFAVDIEPSAVDITQLRLWLSLVIEDEINPNAQNALEGHRNPLPLPNLECNILCGNSLVDEFMGVKLERKSSIIGTIHEDLQMDLVHSTYETVLHKLLEEQDKLFYCDDITMKEDLKRSIQSYKDIIIKEQLSWASPELQEQYEKVKYNASKPFILWPLDFARVFRDKGGFDIVIGNPPYIDSETMVNSGLEAVRDYIAKNYEFCKGNWDIYIAFFEKGFKILSSDGYQIFITPDKWISKPFGDKLRISQISYINQILVAGRDVFESALVDSIVTSFCKTGSDNIRVYKKDGKNCPIEHVRTVSKGVLSCPFTLDIIFSDYIELVGKIAAAPLTLGEICSCESACATSDCYILKDILYSLNDLDEFNEAKHYRVINTGTVGRFKDRWSISPMKYLKDNYLIPVVDKEKFETTFPNSYGKKAKKSKIIIKGLTLLDASLDFHGNTVPGKSTMIIAIENLEVLKLVSAFINSKISIFYIKQRYSSSSYNGGITFTKDMINNLPFVNMNEWNQKQAVALVDEIYSSKCIDATVDTTELESQIDCLFYLEFGLSGADIEIIEKYFMK